MSDLRGANAGPDAPVTYYSTMNMKVQFRAIAKARLQQAKLELASSNDEHLKYAALELRMAIEAITYDRAQAYRAEIPSSDYAVWQPKKLMQLLLDIDPSADQKATISIGLEPSPGVTPSVMHTLGTDQPLSLLSIKAHYDALGSYLHLPTLRQVETDTAPDMRKLRARCAEIVRELEGVLSSHVFNSTVGQFATLECIRCSKPIRKRVPANKSQDNAHCFECGAPYLVASLPNGKSEWVPQMAVLKCARCEEAMSVWRDRIRAGERFQCSACSAPYAIELRVLPLAPTSDEPTAIGRS
jgi:DNA-directed RNA polymerase subunit RPC12/RpoP